MGVLAATAVVSVVLRRQPVPAVRPPGSDTSRAQRSVRLPTAGPPAAGQDLLYSLGAFLTVCEIKRNHAAERLRALAESGVDPGAAGVELVTGAATEATDDTVASIDLEQVARDRLQSFLDAPRLCVQVKSGNAVDVKVVRELHGVLSTVNADQGLLVAWGGLTKSADAEARSQFFRVRVWTADDLLDALTRNYELLPEEIQAELPMKRIWTLVLDEEG